jgi:hypothetical protein
MFSESEITALIEDPKLLESIRILKKQFKKEEAPYLEISDHDFFCLVILMPSVAIALSKGPVSLMEEMALHKRARTVSKGGYYLKKDPVVYALRFLIDAADRWEEKFYELIRLAMQGSLEDSIIRRAGKESEKQVDHPFHQLIFKSPYLLIRFMQTFFWEENDLILNEKRRISKVEYDKMGEIAKRLNLENTLIFKKFLDNFDVF